MLQSTNFIYNQYSCTFYKTNKGGDKESALVFKGGIDFNLIAEENRETT